ncbi:FAD-binding protein [Chloroflexi bacterium TSY]|nr:FAD-binding protein [Chloroflexi bacterium TSY]
MMRIQSITDIQEAVCSNSLLLPRGGGTKEALSRSQDEAIILDMSGLSGILEYDPGEYTFTALAGTSISAVEEALAEHGQYLPFEPPFAEKGATLGGTVAAGLSGSARQRYGGVRDFLIGIRFVDGRGQVVLGGGKVVKNAAGFDLPKLMVGSLGRLGILTEVSFKVFPQPRNYATLSKSYSSFEQVMGAIQKLATSSFDIEALDFASTLDGDGSTLWVRLGGLPDVLGERLTQLTALLEASSEDAQQPSKILRKQEDRAHWRKIREFEWLQHECALIKVPVTLSQVKALMTSLIQVGAQSHYSAGGNLAWIGWNGNIDDLDRILLEQKLSGLTILGDGTKPWLGHRVGQAFVKRIKQALDPEHKFLEIY